MSTNTKILVISFVALGVATRTIWHLGANIEFVTSLSLLAGYFLTNKKLALAVPILIMIISDIIIGNTLIFVFTWSGFLLPVAIGLILSTKLKKTKMTTKLLTIQASAALSNIIFFLWTNLGVVLVSSLYPKTINGLMQSYINGLPFLKAQLGSNLIIAPILFIAVSLIMSLKVKPYLKTNYNKI